LGDDCWHVDVQQKVPLSRDRDNVNPAYLRKVRAAVLNAMVGKLTPEETELGWVEAAAGAPEAKEDTIKTMLGTRFGGREMVLPVKSDPGATREAQSKGVVVLDRALTGDLRKRVKDLKNNDGSAFVAPATEKYASMTEVNLGEEIPMQQWSQSTREYVSFIERVAPSLVGQRIRVKVIDNDDTSVQGCLKWQSGIMLVNLANHNTEDWVENYDLFIHEMAHTDVHNNDHLSHKFYGTVSRIGAKLAQLPLNVPSCSANERGWRQPRFTHHVAAIQSGFCEAGGVAADRVQAENDEQKTAEIVAARDRARGCPTELPHGTRRDVTMFALYRGEEPPRSLGTP